MKTLKVKVLLADDHAILRAGLRRLLEERPEIEAVGEAESAAQTLELMRTQHWDVLLLDLDMPGCNSIDLLKHIKAAYPALAVLILSMYPEEQFGLRSISAGAAGYLNKGGTPEQLIMAINRVNAGGAYISAGLALALAQTGPADPVDMLSKLLSDREFTVLRELAAGKSITAIAKQLALSAKTVSTYRARLMVRLNLRNNVELARYAAEHGLVK
jgi:two-component system, NarL family, invasion response regulator UvrY